MLRSGGSRRWFGLCGVLTLLAVVGCSNEKPGGKVTVPVGSNPGTPSADAPAQPKPAGGTRRIILLTNGNSPFWDAGRAGMEDAKKALNLADAGLDAILEVNDGTIGGQISKLRQYNSQADTAGVAISAIDAANSNVAEELKKLKKKGIAVVTFDSDVDRAKFRDARTAFIGTDNLQGGKELGICAKLLLPDGGEFVTFVGLSSAQTSPARTADET